MQYLVNTDFNLQQMNGMQNAFKNQHTKTAQSHNLALHVLDNGQSNGVTVA